MQLYVPVQEAGDQWRFQAMEGTKGTLAANRTCSIYEFVAYHALQAYLQRAHPGAVPQQLPFELPEIAVDDQSINQSKRKTSNANGQTNLGHKHKAPDHNHEATQPMVDLPHTS